LQNSLTGWYVASVAPPVDETVNGKYRYQGWRPCLEWCTQVFGEMRSPDSPPRWRFVSEGIFEFRDKQDLVAFLLRWG
jgi:hypothetical protein